MEVSDEKLKKQLYLISIMRDEPTFRKTLEDCGAEKILALKLIAVAKRFRGRGVATVLGRER